LRSRKGREGVGILVAGEARRRLGEGPEEDLAKGGGGVPIVATRESFARGVNGRRRGVPRKGQEGCFFLENFIWASRRTWVPFWSDPSSCLGL
jgi:hypothetical protein